MFHKFDKFILRGVMPEMLVPYFICATKKKLICETIIGAFEERSVSVK